MSGPITRFNGYYTFLSNFWPASIDFEGINYPTVEHAYQASKTLDFQSRLKIAATRSPGKAKRLGRTLTIREDWDEVKLDIMYTLVKQKFIQHYPLGKMLLWTAPRELIEGNTWGDTFWGVCRGKGHNHLGKILMRVRDELESDTSFW